ncbi:MAG: nitrilase-related carbon-nitrogen hydrolase, partial [Burkholderiales bacterium]
MNQTIGDFAGNVERIQRAAHSALAAGASVLVTPEMSITGYPPEDLLLRDAFHDRSAQALAELQQASTQWPGLHVVV